MPRADFHFTHPLRVRWAEVDRQGIVFNGHYLTYFDIGITEYWRALGFPYPEGLISQGSDLYVKKASVEYHASAEYDDMIDICVRVARIGNSSMQFLLEIYRGETLLVNGQVVYVNADPATRKAVSVPKTLRDAIGKLENLQSG
ncbi:MAG: thioesterase family protein [Burkholderiales bacterium]